MRVLITGATGYFGAEVTAALLQSSDSAVTAHGRNQSRIEQLRERFRAQSDRLRSVNGDLFELDEVPEGTDVVIHAAAIREVKTPAEIEWMKKVNEEGTRRLLQLAATHGPMRRFVYVSTQGVYGRTGAPWTEESPCCPMTDYAATKYEGERISTRFSDRLRISIVRLARLYGVTPFARWSELPAVFARRTVAGEPLPIYGSGEQRFDLLHVSDAARCIALLARADLPESGRVFNLGGGGSVSVNRLVETFRGLAVNRGLPRVQFERFPDRRVEGPHHLELDISRAKHELGWAPRVTLEEGLTDYLEALEQMH